MATIYEIIDRLCAEKGISGSKMCDDLGMSRSTLTELRKGRAKTLKLEKASKIADYFGVSVDYLLGNEPKEKTPAEADVTFDDFTYAMYGESQDLTEEDKNILLDMARMLKKRQQERKQGK